MERERRSIWLTLAALCLFGVSFGYVEAAVVVYLREFYDPLKQQLQPDRRPGELFPLVTLDQLEAAGGSHQRLLNTEILREVATLAMLAAMGLAVGASFNSHMAAFLVAFGVWDIFYYVFLKLLIDWPASVMEWDLLFLVPLPWVAPVLAPVLVALSMIAAGAVLLARESSGRPVHIGWSHWLVIVLGGVIIVVAFCWDYRRIMAGETPSRFPWGILVAGEAIGVAGFAVALVRKEQGGSDA